MPAVRCADAEFLRFDLPLLRLPFVVQRGTMSTDHLLAAVHIYDQNAAKQLIATARGAFELLDAGTISHLRVDETLHPYYGCHISVSGEAVWVRAFCDRASAVGALVEVQQVFTFASLQ